MTFTLEVALRTAIAMLLRKTGADRVAIAVAQADLFVCRIRSGKSAPHIGTTFSVDLGAIGSCIRTAKLIHRRDTRLDDAGDQVSCAASGIRSVLVAPIVVDGIVVGVIEVASTRPNAFQPSYVKYLEAIANWVGGTCDCAGQCDTETIPQPFLPITGEIIASTECSQPDPIAGQGSRPEESENQDPGIAAFRRVLDEMPLTSTWEDICHLLVPRFKA